MINVFEGASEYRYFDTKNIRSANISVCRIEEYENGFHTFLRKYLSSLIAPYYTQLDLNREFYIRNNDYIEESYFVTKADYTKVYFALSRPNFPKKSIYVHRDFQRLDFG